MRKKLALFCLAAAVTLSASTAMAENIKGKLGVTGRIGFIVPADSDVGPDKSKFETDAGFVGGGGFIYGIDRNIAADLEITHSSYSAETHTESFKGDFDVINIGLGAQYRFAVSQPNLTPYAGAGLDIIISDLEQTNGSGRYDVDTTVGLHIKGGVDYFLTRQVALNAEGKFVVAPETDIKGWNGGTNGNFDPTGFTGTVGVRFFFN
ncbi:porin family protein [Geobacter argillaceus]|uniref:Outer membrane protein n=1 Tax=Geobacter argillaceus TaxID=345631 RepID=A0A562WQA5_9BACT|nr:porin family protein [Geobacter argillaceus]TWJ32489.1 outer membrane protein [Geobacter argillaceus]